MGTIQGSAASEEKI